MNSEHAYNISYIIYYEPIHPPQNNRHKYSVIHYTKIFETKVMHLFRIFEPISKMKSKLNDWTSEAYIYGTLYYFLYMNAYARAPKTTEIIEILTTANILV